MLRASIALAVVLGAAACGAPSRPSPCEPAAAFAPWDAPPASSQRREGELDGAAEGLIAAYQRFLRRPPVPGDGCPFHPTCSVYARQAVRRWGMLGLVLVFDRLFIREHLLAGASYPPTCRGRRTRWHDPVP